MKKMVMYTTGCPKCNILEKKLADKGISFVKCEDTVKMAEIGITNVPVLEKEDGTRMNYFEAVKHINSL